MRFARATRRFVEIWSILAALGLWSCAKMGAPPGGPEDKSGPSVVRQYPEVNAVNVPRRLTARLEFSEPLNRSSVESSLFLSPDPLQRLRYRWRGQVLELAYLDELEADRTYVISVGSQAKDLRGNPAGRTFTIAFSTGSQIDRGRIEGWITDVEAPQGVSIWAYLLSGDSIPDPMTQQADYQIQPDGAGKIHLDYMRTGRYRVIAVTDKDHNNRWNPSSELIGLPPWDVSVTDSTMSWVSFKLANQDTALPSLRSVKDIHAQEIQLRMTAPVSAVSAVQFSQAGDTVGTVDQYVDPAERDTWHIFPSDKLTPGVWTVVAAGLSQFGESWVDAESLTVRERADTTRPKILTSEPPLKGRALTVLSALRLEFVEPVVVDSASLADAYFISPDRDTLRAAVRQVAPRVLTAAPDTTFLPGNYTLKLDGAAVRDLSDNVLGDSTVDLRFGFFGPDSLGSLRIKFSGPNGQYLLSLFTVKDHAFVHQAATTSSGDVRFGNLAPGRYTLEIAKDVDADATYTCGRMMPWQFAEPYLVPVDTISIRARWEQEINLAWPGESP